MGVLNKIGRQIMGWPRRLVRAVAEDATMITKEPCYRGEYSLQICARYPQSEPSKSKRHAGAYAAWSCQVICHGTVSCERLDRSGRQRDVIPALLQITAHGFKESKFLISPLAGKLMEKYPREGLLRQDLRPARPRL